MTPLVDKSDSRKQSKATRSAEEALAARKETRAKTCFMKDILPMDADPN